MKGINERGKRVTLQHLAGLGIPFHVIPVALREGFPWEAYDAWGHVSPALHRRTFGPWAKEATWPDPDGGKAEELVRKTMQFGAWESITERQQHRRIWKVLLKAESLHSSDGLHGASAPRNFKRRESLFAKTIKCLIRLFAF